MKQNGVLWSGAVLKSCDTLFCVYGELIRPGINICMPKLQPIGVSSEVKHSHDNFLTVLPKKYTSYIGVPLLKLTPDEDACSCVTLERNVFLECCCRVGSGCYTNLECSKPNITLKQSVFASVTSSVNVQGVICR